MSEGWTPPEGSAQRPPYEQSSYPAAPPPYGGSPYGAPLPQTQYAAPPPHAYAHWGQRVGATLLDGLVLLPFYAAIVVGVVILGAGSTTFTDLDGTRSTQVHALGGVGIAVMALGYLGAIVFAVWNQVFRQGRTGWSIGKKLMGIRLVDERTGQPIGAGMNFLRQIVHVLDGLACYVGYLWPLWDAKRQTFADKIMHTVEIPAKQPPEG